GTGIQSQSELAVALDVNRSAVSRAKSRDRVPEQLIARLCALFDLDPDRLRPSAEQPHGDVWIWGRVVYVLHPVTA
ncbi:MAG: helix-turn-helix domain-containing protein, partial [Desulfovermiculus sp.]